MNGSHVSLYRNTYISVICRDNEIIQTIFVVKFTQVGNRHYVKLLIDLNLILEEIILCG